MASKPEVRSARSGDVRIGHLAWRGSDAGVVPALLVPGMTGSAESWKSSPRLVDALRDGGRRTVLAVSARGRKGSDCPAAGWSVDHHVGDLLAVLDAEGVSRAHVVGHSMGAFFGLRLAAQHPERVASLVLGDFGTAVGGVGPDWHARIEASGAASGADPRLAERLAAEWKALDLAADGSLSRVAARVLVLRAMQGVSAVGVGSIADFASLASCRIARIDASHEGLFLHPEAMALCLEHVEEAD